VKVIARPYSRICAGPGRQVIRAGKGWSKTDAGPGNDKIILHRSSRDSATTASRVPTGTTSSTAVRRRIPAANPTTTPFSASAEMIASSITWETTTCSAAPG